MNLDYIDPRFVDVAFDRQPEYLFGCQGPGDLSRCTAYEDNFPVIPESDWDRYIDAEEAAGGGLEHHITRIFDQDGEGSCVGNATTQLGEILQAKQFGKSNVVTLSAISLYKRIGSSPGSGAMVSDALDEMAKRGIVPLDTSENRAKFGDCVMPHIGFYSKWPSNWEATAANFKLTEWHVVRSVEGMASALLNQMPVVVGRAGHSICYIKLARRNGGRGVVYVNSWKESWGFSLAGFKGGFGFDSMGMVRSSSSWAFCGHSIVIPQWIANKGVKQ